MAKLKDSLPAGFTQDKQQFVARLKAAEQDKFEPPGTCVSSYSIDQDGDAPSRGFEIYELKLEGNEPAQQLHANLQTLSLWFIEGAEAFPAS